MSLLNDALRAAEQRQNRPEVAGAYTGQVSAKDRGKPWLWAIVLLLAAGVIAVSAYWFQAQTSSEKPPALVSATPVAESEPVLADVERQPAREPELSVESDPEPVPEPEITRIPEPAVPEQKKQVIVEQPVAKVAQPEPELSAPKPAADAPEPQVKQIRETPKSIDLRVSRELASLLRSGATREAEQRLQQLAASQPAIASREVFARQMLVQGMPGRALVWLPESAAASDAGLRLLRARALHASSDLPGAVATLERDVPAAGQNMEYRVTLATLLQQAGRSAEAARQWSVLIAQDDSRAAWWVGLAIALETGGEVTGAVRAYGQAAQLPGLSPSLADYVRERLKTLQAG
ncbi:MSHA biogenesis protein MshN [Marinobacter guineae]|uniref:MSHA biogenesis protein MshN n=1 Tax=Marinobacter guineae TaxID=432303 RepID=A0A2G1VAM3_9GAMM|nr:MSHA biogenesis protein MshN [Marinobacter guineae]PHQ23821.1 MSHA biogenesis protein MshN [Marinobacter guineae]